MKSSFVEINTNPIIEIIPADFLSYRLDVDYYRPEYLKLESQLQDLSFERKRMTEISKIINDGPGGWSLQSSEYLDDGIPLIRIVDFRSNLDPSGMIYISPVKHEELKRYEVLPGDVLISAAGSIGEAQVLPESIGKANFRDLIRIRLKPGTDSYYLSAYLNSKYGRMITRRFAHGAVQLHLKVYDAKEITVVLPDPKIQAYIGDKVRLAERCREEAINLWDRAKQILADSLGLALSIDTYQSYDLKDLETNFYQAISKTPVICWAYPNIVDDRIGAQFFHPRRENIIQKLRGSCEVKKLSDLAKRVTKRISAEKAAHLGYVGLSEIDSTNGFFEPISMDQAETVGVSSYFESRDVLFSKLRPYLNKVSICPDYINEACGSTELLVYRANGSIPPYYLFFVLKSNIGLYQIIDLTAGSTLPRVDSDIIDDLLIPLISKDMQGEIDHKIHMVFNLLQSARDLIHQSQSDVEALIENRLPVDQVLSGKLCAPTFDGIYNQLQ